METNLLEKIQNHVRQNQTEAALYLLMQISKSDDVILNKALLVSARQYALNDAIVKGVINYENETISRGQINEAILMICKEIKDFLGDEKSSFMGMHILNEYPTGPLVLMHLVDRDIITTYAQLMSNPFEISMKLEEANAFRLAADADATIINRVKLPPVENTAAENYWFAVFREACNHGPKMLAALLLTVSDEQFTRKVKDSRFHLLERLKNHK